jgi:hypothetical protein
MAAARETVGRERLFIEAWRLMKNGTDASQNRGTFDKEWYTLI